MSHQGDPTMDSATVKAVRDYYMIKQYDQNGPYVTRGSVDSGHENGNGASSPYADYQTLESRFGRFGLSDSTTRQDPVRDHNNNQFLAGPGMTNGHGHVSSLPSPPPPSPDRSLQDFDPRLRYEQYNNRFNGFDANQIHKYESYGRDPFGLRVSNYTGEIPFTPRNQYPFYVSGIRNGGGGSVYSPDLYPTRNRFTILSRARDRGESQKLQDLIVDGSREKIDEIFDGVIAEVCQLMVDPLGYHVFQKLLLKLTNDQITRVLDMVIQNPIQFASICVDPHGTRAVQDLMRNLRGEEQVSHFMVTLSHVALMLTRSTNANHVILLSFNLFTPAQSQCLLKEIVQNCYKIAIDQHGCCMLQQCIGKSSGDLREHLISGIIFNALRLCVNCYGNYVVQYVLELNDCQVAPALAKQLEGHYVHLSRDKYGSHAVQKCLKNPEISSRSIILNELITDIDSLLVDPFGNYVIQTAWIVSQDDVREVLYYHVRRNQQLMSCNRYGRKVLEQLHKISGIGRRLI